MSALSRWTERHPVAANWLFLLLLIAVGALAYCSARDYERAHPYQEQPGAP